MARVTVEDCIEHVPNRFELVLIAAQRAKQIAAGNPLTIDRDNDKDAVVSLREIADQTVSLENLKEDAINSFSKRRHDERRLPPRKSEKSEDEIQEAFADAQQHINTKPEEGEASGMSFGDENIDIAD